MDNSKSYEIVFGRVDLERLARRKNQPKKVTANGVVFRNCDASKSDPHLLMRVLRKYLAPNYRKLEGWRIVALHPEKHLGKSIARKPENVAE